MKQYLELLKELLDCPLKNDRTGVGTYSKFGHQMRFNLQEGLPVVTTKKIHLKSVIHELLWILSGNTNIKYLNDNGVTIWNEWSNENGDLGPIYGHQWRKWEYPRKNNSEDYPFIDIGQIDQISNLINEIKINPNSRRLIVTAWNPADIDKMALAPCHCYFQCYVNNGKLSLQLVQRSADFYLGTPFNIVSYSLLTYMIAQVCGLKVGDFIYTLGDVHLYTNHVEQAKLQLKRKPYNLPKISLNQDIRNIFDFKYDDFIIHDYKYHPTIKAPVAI